VEQCISCGVQSKFIIRGLSICLNCIRTQFNQWSSYLRSIHAENRKRFDLPANIPDNEAGISCKICGNNCKIKENERGFCGLRIHQNRRLVHLAGTANRGLVSWYHDPLPTNCVASWVCPAGTGCGFPEYAYRKDGEYGYYNLAVFYEACSFDCLFCQNWHFRDVAAEVRNTRTAEELAAAVNSRTACICYFGGDPSPQLPHAIAASKLALKKATGRILRICWETNGNVNRALLNKMLNLSITSGGCIKFDLKAWDEGLHIALTGVTNRQTIDNFRWLAQFFKKRPDPPLLIASTLLVPGYIDEEEIFHISEFIATLNPDIPYSLLAFYPEFEMSDLPTTSRQLAEECLSAAHRAGLTRVHLGNIHLLDSIK
jgi:pyruvate formate lyase activating enzyme